MDKKNLKKTALVYGGGGFIGGHRLSGLNILKTKVFGLE